MIIYRITLHIITDKLAGAKHIHYKVWDEITYPLPNFNGGTAG